jgi:VanZ family protein
MKIIHFILYFWKSILIISIILYLSFAPPSTFNGVPTFENEDKLVHLIMYAGLTGVLIFDFRRYSKINTMSIGAFIIICLLFPVFLGGAVEILQPMYFAPRTAEWTDWFSDIAGMLIGWTGMRFITPKLSRGYFN